ncbi:MAG: hypothetical protein HOE53_03670 [Candidatus Magasanikbacteria bacterium]|jgi:hypothetical protein|nr:hypothetical protein [Candidatus Magasanikbacteria bacterium]
MKKILLISISLFFLSGCSLLMGEELVRVDVDKLSEHSEDYSETVTVMLEEGKVYAIWTDMDVSYGGLDAFKFMVNFSSKDAGISTGSGLWTKQANTTVNKVSKTIGGKTTERYSAKIGEFVPTATGEYNMKAKLDSSGMVSEIRNADIFLTEK